MKKFSFSALLTVLAIAALFSGAFAQAGLPGSGWWTGEQIQNIGSSTGTISVTAYPAVGSSDTNTYTANTSVEPGAAYTFLPNDFSGMPDGFQGSAVVSANQPIKAIVNVTNRLTGDLGVAGGEAAAQYQGIDSSMVATDLYFPLVKAGHFNKTTTFFVQNAGSAPATATATFTMRNGDTHTYTTPSIPQNRMVAFDVTAAATWNDAGQPANWEGRVGSLVVTSAQPLAGTVMEHFTAEPVATIAQATRAFTAADFDDKAYAPIIKNDRFARFTGIQVQNVSAGAIDVTVTYTGSAGTCAGNTYSDSKTGVAAGSAHTFIQLTAQGTSLPADCTAAATITATGNFVAVVNESYVTGKVPASGQAAVTSSAIPDKSTTTKVSAPLFKDDRLGKRTGLQVQNVGASTATNVVATFICRGGTTASPTSFTAITQPLTLVSGGAVLFYTPSNNSGGEPPFTAANPFATSNVNCSVTITADQPIVALANESVIPGGALQQDNNNYEGFNLAP